MAEAMYAHAAQGAAGATPGTEPGAETQEPPKEGTMDADFTVVDDEEKK